MSAFAQDLERRLIPRWRFSDAPTNAAEFASDPRNKRLVELDKSFLDEKLFDWKLKRSVGNAIDLVSCGLSGRWISEIQPAAEFLLSYGEALSPQVTALAERAIQFSTPNPCANLTAGPSSPEMTFEVACQRVSISKKKLHRDPRNVLAWVDLARAYAILGQNEKAMQSVERALYLAPNSRQVLRSAVRLFIHSEEKERAHTLLIRNPRTKRDPWLIAAEIATAKIAERDPRLIRQGRMIVENSGLPPEQLSELQSALGTADYYGGSNRKAKQRFRESLIAPTDNALAQARWMRTQISGIHIDDLAFSLPLGYEARSWRALEESRWEDGRDECGMWLADEPFSSRPATVGSYIGLSLTNDYEFAEECARVGLLSEPGEQTLRNNLSVALAYQGRTDEALKEFAKITVPLSSDFPGYVYTATAGLLQFRMGEIESGREYYEKAAELAPTKRRHRVAIFRAREELAAGTPEAEEHLRRALEYESKVAIDDTKRLQALLKEQSEQIRAKNVPPSAPDKTVM